MRRLHVWACALATLLSLSGCAIFQQYAALQNVDWTFEGVSDVRVADIALGSTISSYEDLDIPDLARLLDAVSRGQLPLELVTHVGARNPSSNSVAAHLMDLDWTLFIEDRKTVGGTLGRSYTIPAGEFVDVPVAVRLDLMEFVEGGSPEALNFALAVAGYGSKPSELRVELVPTIETSLGPMTYPAPIVVRRKVGRQAE